MRPHSRWSLLTRPSIHCRALLLLDMAHLLVRHEEGLNPVVVALLVDPIGDGHCFLRNLEPLAEGPGEALQSRAGQGPQAAVEVLNRVGIEGLLAGISRG
jgi:hypothetical protein